MCQDFDKFTFSRGLSADDPHLLLCRQTVTQSDTTKEHQQQSSVVKLVSCVNTSQARVIGERASLVCYVEVIDLAPCLTINGLIS